MSSPIERSLPEVARGLRAREFSALDLMQQALERHERFGAALDAYKLFAPERALAGARAADARLAGGGDVPPLTGIPMSIKDLYGVEGMPTFGGTKRQMPAKWSENAWLVERLVAAGAITVGKTHMVEMAFGGVGLNPHWSTPHNPWDASVHRVPGGSSSGAGVSLWEGSALIALGSDTGGSIRIPAAFTGTVGQRTTRGRWPTTGVVPLSETFDTVGALTRTVEDSVYFFGSVDPEWGDPAALLSHVERTRVDGMRIAVPGCEIADAAQGDIANVLERALTELEGAGARLSETDGRLFDDAFELVLGGGTIAATECRSFLERELPGWLEILHPIVRERLVGAASPLDPMYLAGIAEHHRMAERAESLFDGVDVIALPANIITPPSVDELDDYREIDRYLEVNRAILRPTYPAGVLGLTAVSIPVGLDDAGMPVGLQLIGRGSSDAELLGIALAVEQTLGTARDRLGIPPAIV